MDDRAVDRFVRSALEAERPDAGPHPEPDVLFSYHALELSDEDLERVQAHLSLCPRCARAVADLEAFPALDPPSDDDLPSDADLAAGWADVQRRLAAGEGAADVSEGAPAPVAERARKVVLPFTPPTPTRVRPALQGVRAAAAVLAVTTLGAAFLAFNARQEVKEARAIRADDFSAILRSYSEQEPKSRGGGRRISEPFRVPAGARRVHLEIPLPPTLDGRPYRAELRDESGIVVWAGLIPSPVSRSFATLSADRESLRASTYVLRVSEEGTHHPVDEFRFELTYSP